MITVVIPLYNKAATIQRAVQSVLDQTYESWKLIIVNDGSTDSGPELCRGYPDKRISVYDQSNQGVSAARNMALKLAETELIAFLDGDDYWHHDFLAIIQKLYYEFSGADVFATLYGIIKTDGTISYPKIKGTSENFNRGIIDNYFEVAGKSDPPIHSSAVAITKKALQHIGGFPVGLESGEDLLTWARLAAQFDIAYDMSVGSFFDKSEIERPPDPDSYVLDELLKLSDRSESSVAIKRYAAFWAKMQSVSALYFTNQRLTKKYIIKYAMIRSFDKTFMAIFAISFLPISVRRMLIKLKRKLTK